MAISSGTRSLIGELVSWTAAAAILVAGLIHYDTIRTTMVDVIGLAGSSPTSEESPPQTELVKASPANGREILNAHSDGHYYARAEINGRPLDVMVDTGASMVALTYEDAERAGLRLRPADFTARVGTANGVAAVAPVTLDRITIGRITVRNVQAAVTEPGRMAKTLLGMSFLSRLDRVDISSGRLLLVE